MRIYQPVLSGSSLIQSGSGIFYGRLYGTASYALNFPNIGSGSSIFVKVSDTPLVYATDKTIKLKDISSSLFPFTSSLYNTTFRLGSNQRPWRSLHLSTEGIYFVAPSTGLAVSMSAGTNYISIGKSKVKTQGFETTGSLNIKHDGTSNNIVGIYSGSSIQISVNKDGILISNPFVKLPSAVDGGLAFSGSNFFVGL